MSLLLGTASGGAASAVPGPELELEWEVGRAGTVWDGDTLQVEIDRSSSPYSGSQRVRMVGVNAPETTTPECGGAEAKALLKTLAPTGTPIQLRAQKGTSFDTTDGRSRLVRSVYAQDDEGNWYDLSRQLVGSGRVIWFPFSDTGEQPEWAHNLEYRVLATDAQREGRGLWAGDTCGGWRGDLNIRMWAKYWGTERVYVENNGPAPIDLSGWIVRDAAVKGYRTLPVMAPIQPGEAREVYAGDMNLNNLPADNPAFEGDSVYLMEPANAQYTTGNLRAWFPYPCNPDDCTDPLEGAISLSTPVPGSPSTHKPSQPGSVKATSTTNGSGQVTVTWAASKDAGGPNLSYSVTPIAVDGGPPVAAATGLTVLTHTFSGLQLGKAYQFEVRAVSDGGTSEPVSSTPAVAAAGAPGPVPDLILEPRDAAVAVSWTGPTSGGVDANTLSYRVAVDGDASKGCETIGATSCVVDKLKNGTSYTFQVTATNAHGASIGPALVAAPSPDPAVSAAPAPPTSVQVTPGKGSLVVAWPRALTTDGSRVSTYTASVLPGGPSCTASGGATSCVITGLTDGTSYTTSVTATNSAGTSAPALGSPATPFTSPTVRESTPTSAPPPVADPWKPGFVDLTNTSPAVARLGGYGLWDARSSRYDNNGKLENRAAYLFEPGLALQPGQTLRVYFGTTAAAAAAPGGDVQVYAGGSIALGQAGDFVELGNLNGAQVACMAINGSSCARAKPQAAPTQPVGVTARTTPSSVTVAWGAPISRGGLAISGYTATAYDAQVGGAPIGSCATDGSGRSCSFPGSIGTRYWVEVVAANAAGASGPSWRVLAAPRTVPSAPGNVTVSGTPGGLNVAWTPAAENGAPITRYTAAAYRVGTGGAPVGTCTTSNGSMSGCTIMRLEGGTQYYVDVVATNRAGNGSPSSPRVAATPGPGGAVSTYSKGKVTVRWDPPNPGSNTVTGYVAKLYTKSSGGSKVGECAAPAGATQCTTRKMKKRSKYYIELTMRSAAGDFTIKPRIVTGPPKKASAPKVTSATPSGRSAVIAWAPPSFNGYSYLKTYGARLYSKSKGGSVKASCTANASALTCTTKALKKKGTYYAAARVKNAKGWSSWSKRVKVVVR